MRPSPIPQGVFRLIGISQDLPKVLVIQENACPHKENNGRKRADKGGSRSKRSRPPTIPFLVTSVKMPPVLASPAALLHTSAQFLRTRAACFSLYFASYSARFCLWFAVELTEKSLQKNALIQMTVCVAGSAVRTRRRATFFSFRSC